MNAMVKLFLNELRLKMFEMRQYWFETVSATLFLTIIFVGVFYGVKMFVYENAPGATLDELVFGFFLWLFASSAYSSATNSVVEDSQKGFIEQLFLCPLGFKQLIIARVLVEVFIGYLMMLLMALICMTLTGNWIAINFALLFALLVFSAPALVGLGFVLSGLALVYKKIETITALMNILIIGLVVLPALPLNVFSLLPFAPGAALARSAILNHLPPSILDIMVVGINSAVYFVVGFLTFSVLEKKARRMNLIGQY